MSVPSAPSGQTPETRRNRRSVISLRRPAVRMDRHPGPTEGVEGQGAGVGGPLKVTHRFHVGHMFSTRCLPWEIITNEKTFIHVERRLNCWFFLFTLQSEPKLRTYRRGSRSLLSWWRCTGCQTTSPNVWQSWSGPENGDNITHCVRPNVLKHSDNFISNWKKGHIYFFFSIFVNNMTFIFSDICLQCTSQRGCTFVHSPSQHRCKQSCHGKPRQGSYHLKTQGRQSSQQLAFYWWIWLNTPVDFEYVIVEISHINTVFFQEVSEWRTRPSNNVLRCDRSLCL